MSELSGTGFYGKFPELGDFVNRRIPRTFLEPWDEWLQSAIASSREQLGDGWLDVYLSGPIWCFILPAGLCGELSWAGLFMPSVDRVGRYYPLTVASSIPLDVNPIQLSIDGREWFDKASQVILSALDEQGFDMDEFDFNVSNLGDPSPVAGPDGPSGQFGYGSAWRIALDQDAGLNTALPALMHQLVLQRLGEYSLWWTTGSQYVEPSMLLTAGMPDAQDFSALLTGNWKGGNWDECLQPVQELEAFLDEIPGEQADT